MAKEQTTVEVTRKVKIISPKARYSNTAYLYAVPTSLASGLPVTGQESVIPWHLTTVSRANGGEDKVWVPDRDITKLSAADRTKLQMGDHPFIINPAEHIIVMHGKTYDNSYNSIIEKDKEGMDVEVDREYKNPKDHAELTAIMAGSETPVAKSKSEYKKTRHHFYIDDKEVEAQKELDVSDQRYEANKFMRDEIGTGRYPEMILFLGYMIPEYKIKPEILSDTRMKALIYKACEEHPDVVLKYKGPNANRYVFVLKLIQKKIIAVDHNMNYKYGDIPLGVNIDSVIQWMDDYKTNGHVVTKWQRLLNEDAEKSVEIPV